MASLTQFLLRTRFELSIYSRVTLTLLKLRQATDAGIAFPGYEEGPLVFHPTCRYDIGTDTYDAGEERSGLDRCVTAYLTGYCHAELVSSGHRWVFVVLRTVEWIVDRAKRDALARLLLENMTSIYAGENLVEKLAALTLHPPANDRACLNAALGFRDLMEYPVPLPSSEDYTRWDGPGAHRHSLCQFVSHSLTFQPLEPRFNRSSKRVFFVAEGVRYRSTNPFNSPIDSQLLFSLRCPTKTCVPRTRRTY